MALLGCVTVKGRLFIHISRCSCPDFPTFSDGTTILSPTGNPAYVNSETRTSPASNRPRELPSYKTSCSRKFLHVIGRLLNTLSTNAPAAPPTNPPTITPQGGGQVMAVTPTETNTYTSFAVPTLNPSLEAPLANFLRGKCAFRINKIYRIVEYIDVCVDTLWELSDATERSFVRNRPTFGSYHRARSITRGRFPGPALLR